MKTINSYIMSKYNIYLIISLANTVHCKYALPEIPFDASFPKQTINSIKKYFFWEENH